MFRGSSTLNIREVPKKMNSTPVREFILLGFTDNHKLQVVLFLLLMGTYLLTISGNVVIVAITLSSRRLHTPMYFFLRNFALLEVGFTTALIPKALAHLATGQRTISISGCFTQCFLYFTLGTTEFFLLAVMSFDRYVAICHPLRYATIMSGQLCSLLVGCSWVGGLLLILGPAIALFQMPFCGPNTINHFFCDNGPLIKLACVDTILMERVDFFIATFSLIGTLAVTVISYANIISSILRIPSTQERQKAFSTCSSHIIVVSLFYGSCIFMYVRPSQSEGFGFNKGVSILNTVVTPLLNPFIYTLRNKQVHEALRDAKRKICIRNRKH
ncbi:olfactory receptor 6E1-like [Heteronotia binoei]|uniref:olfactory receptor 6E1-like n=1 Tax=Heteronotia binoei TaxID=13085 RepID=UPI002930098D|nr:olfactory receptor 6E1-like [Heteronotia binoei]